MDLRRLLTEISNAMEEDSLLQVQSIKGTLTRQYAGDNYVCG